MKIGIDARSLTEHPKSGVALYTREIIAALRRVSNDEIVLFSEDDVTRRLRRLPIIAHHLAFARAVDKAKLDVFFSPTGLLPLGLSTPSVVFIHDLIMLKHPEWFPDSALQRFFTLRLTLPLTISRARRLVVPSQTVRDDLVRFFPAAQGKVEVVPEGVRVEQGQPPDFAEASSGRRRVARTGLFLLSVGTLEPRKNIETAIKAFERVALRHQDLEFLIIGGQGFGAAFVLDAIDQANRRLGRQAVRYLGAVSEEEKWMLYQNAKILLAISYDEGFYLPPFEALSVGTPVVATAVGAVPDLLSDAVTIVQPDDVDGIAQAIHNTLMQKPIVVAPTFSWDTAAKQTLELMRKASISGGSTQFV